MTPVCDRPPVPERRPDASRAATPDEQSLRRWAVEQTIAAMAHLDEPEFDIVAHARELEDYVLGPVGQSTP